MEPKILGESPDKRFALLIDADNVSAKYIKPILDELSKYGTVTIKRIYGDWTLTLHAKWKDALLENSITPIQQFSYTYGKNATDSAMIIDAMDILYGGQVEGFCLVSSDSDFTRLASRLRESGLTVVGMGEKKTPTPFRRACDIFTTLELLVQNNKSNHSNVNSGPMLPISEVEQAVVDIITDNSNNGKATGLGEVGSRLLKRYPEFDVRSYGTNLLSKLLEDFTRVVIKKDRNNLTVELAESVPREEVAKSEEDVSRTKDEAGKSKEGDANPKCDNVGHEQEPAKRALPLEKLRKALPKGEGVGKKKPAPAVDKKDKPLQEDTSDAKQGDDADVKDASGKPHRVRRNRNAKKISEPMNQESNAEAVEKVAAEERPEGQQLVEDRESVAKQPVEKPGKPSASKKAVAAKKSPAAKKPPVAAKPKQQSPASFIQSIVDRAGIDGMNVADVGNALRHQFKDFKVKDLGYPRLATYLQEQPQYRLERRDGVVHVFTKNPKA